MKKAISILHQYIRSYHSMIELYEANPHNQAITEYTANGAKKNIVELQAAIAALEMAEVQKPSTNNDYAKCLDDVPGFIAWLVDRSDTELYQQLMRHFA